MVKYFTQWKLLLSLKAFTYIKHKFYGARLSYRFRANFMLWYRSNDLIIELKNNSSTSYMHNLNGNQSLHLSTYTNLKISKTKEKSCKAYPHGQFYHGNLEKYVTFTIYNQLDKMTKIYKNWKQFSLSYFKCQFPWKLFFFYFKQKININLASVRFFFF